MLLKTKDGVDVDIMRWQRIFSSSGDTSLLEQEVDRGRKGARFPEHGLSRPFFPYFSARMSRLPKGLMPLTVFTLGSSPLEDIARACLRTQTKRSSKSQGGGNQETHP